MQLRLEFQQGLLDGFIQREREAAGIRAVDDGEHARLQFAQALTGGCHDRHPRAAVFLGQCYVHHVQRHHQRHAHLEQLNGEIEVALEVRGIDNIHHEVGVVCQQVVARNLLIE